MSQTHRGRAVRVVRNATSVLPMTGAGGSGPDGPPVHEPYRPTDYWAGGDYGYSRRGSFQIINTVGDDAYQTLPSSITLPSIPDAHSLDLFLDVFETYGFYNDWTRREARILIDGEVWKDWWTWTTPILPGQAASWPPPAGTATVQIRASFQPPAGTENYLDYRWTDVRLLRYVISVWTPNP